MSFPAIRRPRHVLLSPPVPQLISRACSDPPPDTEASAKESAMFEERKAHCISQLTGDSPSRASAMATRRDVSTVPRRLIHSATEPRFLSDLTGERTAWTDARIISLHDASSSGANVCSPTSGRMAPGSFRLPSRGNAMPDERGSNAELLAAAPVPRGMSQGLEGPLALAQRVGTHVQSVASLTRRVER